MSRRPPALSILTALGLLVAGLVAPLVAGPAMGFGEHVFQSNPVVGPGDPYYSVYSGSTLAESFAVNQTFVLLNTTLRVRNDGSSMNALVVSIHPDDPVRHLPVMSRVLASTSQLAPNNQPAASNVSFTFNPGPTLYAGSAYWIVCENGAPQASSGYEWHHSGADTYPGGVGYWLAPSSGTWTRLPYDLYFINYGRAYSANLTLAMTANHAEAQPADFVAFTLWFNNTGNQSAQRVWVNESLPAGLGNVSTTYPDLASLTPFPNFTFVNVPNGPHSVVITAQVAIGLSPGTRLTNTASLAFANETGVVRRGIGAQASLTIGRGSKQLYLAPSANTLKLLTTTRPTTPANVTLPTLFPGGSVDLVQSPAFARSFRLQNATATLFVASQIGLSLQLNVSILDRNGTATSVIVSTQETIAAHATPVFQAFVFYFPAVDYTLLTGHQIQLHILNTMSSPGNAIIAVNGTSAPSRVGMVTTTYVHVDDLALENQNGPASLWAPGDRLAVLANVSDPFGGTRIIGVWYNLTAPSGGLAAAGPMTLLKGDPSNLSAWRLYSASLNPPLSLGRYRVDILAMEDNGAKTQAEAWATVAVPVFRLEQTASVQRARVGNSFSYFLYYNNTGTSVAPTVWLNDTLPTQLSYVTSSALPSYKNGSKLGWVFSSVAVGPHALEIVVSVPTMATSAVWVRNNASLVFADTSDHVWPVRYSAADVFLNGPILSMSITSVPAQTFDANETIVFTISLRNTGDMARDVWVNSSLPAGFRYVSDTAAAAGGKSSASGPEVFAHFANVSSGTSRSFEIVTFAGATVTRGATYKDVVSLNYSSTTGFLMPSAMANVSLLAVSPYIAQASVVFAWPTAGPGDVVPAAVRFANVGNAPAEAVWINLTLDLSLNLLNTSLPATLGAGSIGFMLSNVGVGTESVFLNFTVRSTTPDQSIVQILGTLEYAHPDGAVPPAVPLTPAALTVAAPKMSITVSPASVAVEAGTAFLWNVTVSNTGTGTARDVWLNLTVPDPLSYVADTSTTRASVIGTTYSWHWSNQSAVSRALSVYLSVRATAPNGGKVDLTFHMDYHALNPRAASSMSATSHVTITAPLLVLTVASSQGQPLAGGRLVYTLSVQNVGAAAANSVWLNDPLDPHLQLLTYASDIPATGNQTLNWTLQDVAPGATMTFIVTVQVGSNVATGTYISAFIEAAYTNSVGTFIGYARSPPVSVTVSADSGPLVAILLGGLVGGAALVLLVRRRTRVNIEDVFLVYRDGVLLSHLSRSLMREKDEDVLSGMLTAVQEFVREAFQYGEHRDLQQLDFGDYRILIERGAYVYVAVVYAGRDSGPLHRKVRAVIARIETEYGPILEKWDGDMEKVVGARDLIRDELLGSNGRDRARWALAQSE